MAFLTAFIVVKLSQFYSITSPALFTKNKKLWNETKEVFFANMVVLAFDVILKEVENPSLDTQPNF